MGRGHKELTKAVKEYTQNVQARLPVTRALLGDGYGNVDVPGRPGFVYVRPHMNPSQVLQVLCKALRGSSGLPVLIGKPMSHQDENMLMVLDVDWGMYSMMGWAATGSSYLPMHGQEHTWGGSDPTPIRSRQIMDGALTATNPPSMIVYVNRYRYWYNGTWQTWEGGYSPSLSGAVPPVGNRFLAFYIDPPTNTLRAATGTVWTSMPPDYDALIPELPSGAIPVGLVQLQPTTTTVSDSRIYELRLLWNHYGIDHTHTPEEGGTVQGVYAPLVNRDTKILRRGDAVIADTSADGSVLASTGSHHPRVLGVVAEESVPIGHTGTVAVAGLVQNISVIGTVGRGQFLYTSEVKGFARASTPIASGTFAIALSESAGGSGSVYGIIHRFEPTGAPVGAPYITVRPDSGLSNETSFGDLIMIGVSGDRPAAGIPGRVYIEEDTYRAYRDDGVSAWDPMAFVPDYNNDLDMLGRDVLNVRYLYGATGLLDIGTSTDMNNNSLYGLPDPVGATQAVPKGWADARYAPITGTFVTVASEVGIPGEYVLGSSVIMRGVTGSKPSPHYAGMLYADSDGKYVLWRSNGATWDAVGRAEPQPYSSDRLDNILGVGVAAPNGVLVSNFNADMVDGYHALAFGAHTYRVLSGATKSLADDTPTSVALITTADQAGSADAGCYIATITLLIANATGAGTAGSTASKALTVQFARAMEATGTGVTTAVIVVSETASAATNAAQRDIGTVTITTTEISEYQIAIQVQADHTGTLSSLLLCVMQIDLLWYGFLTAPVISNA